MTQKQKESGGTIWLLIIAGLIFFAVRNGGGSGPVNPDPGPAPVPVSSEVVKEIREAFAGFPDGTAESYGAYYAECAAVLDVDEATPVPKLRTRMIRAKELLQLKSSEKFGDIVSRELKAFGEGAVDRAEYAKAFRKLAEECRKADE